MVEADKLDQYLEECCRKYALDACAVVTKSGDVLENAGDFIPDICLKAVPEWLSMAYQMANSSALKGLSYACLASPDQRQHLVGWKFEWAADVELFVLLCMRHIPRHMHAIQRDMQRDIATFIVRKSAVLQ